MYTVYCTNTASSRKYPLPLPSMIYSYSNRGSDRAYSERGRLPAICLFDTMTPHTMASAAGCDML